MTKQAKTLITLAVIVVVCGAGYLGLRAWNQSQSEADDTVYITQLSDPTALDIPVEELIARAQFPSIREDTVQAWVLYTYPSPRDIST